MLMMPCFPFKRWIFYLLISVKEQLVPWVELSTSIFIVYSADIIIHFTDLNASTEIIVFTIKKTCKLTQTRRKNKTNIIALSMKVSRFSVGPSSPLRSLVSMQSWQETLRENAVRKSCQRCFRSVETVDRLLCDARQLNCPRRGC